MDKLYSQIKELNYPQKMHLDYIKLCGFENDMNLVFSKTETVRKKVNGGGRITMLKTQVTVRS